jgi:hypothetical protein
VLADKGYDGRAADVWSCGVILYVLLAGFLPFDEPHMSALFRKIQKADFTYPSWFTAPVRALIDRILVADPTKRIGLPDMEADAWFMGPDKYQDDDNPFSVTGGAAPRPGIPSSGGGASAGAGASGGAPGSPGSRAGGAGGPTLAHVPSARDIEEAVADLDDDAVNDKDTGSSKAAAPEGPRVLNAFDVVNMLGGLELARIMDTSAGGASGGAGGDPKRGGGAGPAQAAAPQFLSAAPPATILARLSAALTALGATAVTVDDKTYKVKGKVMTGRGEISVVAVVYRMSDAMQLVEVHRGRGDILEYNSLYTRLREGLADLVVGGKAGAAGGKK